MNNLEEYRLLDCLSDIKQDLTFYSGEKFRSKINTFLFNISFQVILLYRISRYCYMKSKFSGKILGLIRFWQYVLGGNEIDYRANLGHRIKLAHPSGIIIGAGVEIEDDVTIFQQITLGSHGREQKEKEYPIVKKGATIFAGAKVIGRVTLHENSVVGTNSVVLTDVPQNTTVVGIPAKIIKNN